MSVSTMSSSNESTDITIVKPLCKKCGTSEESKFTPKKKDLCRDCKNYQQAKVYLCKTCGEKDKTKFISGRFTSCKKCRSTKSNKYYKPLLDFVESEIPQNELHKEIEEKEIDKKNTLTIDSNQFKKLMNNYLNSDTSYLKTTSIGKKFLSLDSEILLLNDKLNLLEEKNEVLNIKVTKLQNLIHRSDYYDIEKDKIPNIRESGK